MSNEVHPLGPRLEAAAQLMLIATVVAEHLEAHGGHWPAKMAAQLRGRVAAAGDVEQLIAEDPWWGVALGEWRSDLGTALGQMAHPPLPGPAGR